MQSWTLLTLLVAAVAAAAQDADIFVPPPSSKMAELMRIKEASWAEWEAKGIFRQNLANINAVEPCTNGAVASGYKCSGINLHAFRTHSSLGSSSGRGNDVWGWTDPVSRREIAAVGQTDGTSFIEILADGSIFQLGRLPSANGRTSSWRDIDIINGYAYIGADSSPGHGLQIFDLRKLLNNTSSRTYGNADLTARFTGFGSSHNIVASATGNFIYAVGSDASGCRGGLYVVNVTNPAAPTSPGCLSADGYVHDAQSVIYSGPDTRYTGREIVFMFNEDTLTIGDLTDKTSFTSSKILSRTSYTGASYTHQGWLIDTNFRFLLADDELDESSRAGNATDGRTVTYLWDLQSLTAPVVSGIYKSPAIAIDHNQFVLRGFVYQSNYGSGLRVVDVRSVSTDRTGRGFREVAYFDVFPNDDATNGAIAFTGTWSNYPFFPSGYIAVNSIERGIFIVKLHSGIGV